MHWFHQTGEWHTSSVNNQIYSNSITPYLPKCTWLQQVIYQHIVGALYTHVSLLGSTKKEVLLNNMYIIINNNTSFLVHGKPPLKLIESTKPRNIIITQDVCFFNCLRSWCTFASCRSIIFYIHAANAFKV